MSSLSKLINDAFDEKAKSLHCAFLAKVLSVSGNKAKIQPLGLTKQYGKSAQAQPVMAGVHISKNALYKVTPKDITYVYNSDDNTKTQAVAVPEPIAVGDVVVCVCCDRNIDAALKGKNELPPVGSHNKSDCVIVAII